MGAASCQPSDPRRGSEGGASILRRVRLCLMLAAASAAVAGWLHLAVTLGVMH